MDPLLQSHTHTLRDGTTIAVRPVRPDDAPRLQALHARLSPESIRLRFLAMHVALSREEAERLADLDFESRVAFAAVVPAPGGDEDIVGVARYARLGPERPAQAEAAIVVEDRYQRLGAGTILVDHLLAYARTHGVRAFVAEVSHENDRMLEFIRRSGLPFERKFEDGVWQIRIDIVPEPPVLDDRDGG